MKRYKIQLKNKIHDVLDIYEITRTLEIEVPNNADHRVALENASTAMGFSVIFPRGNCAPPRGYEILGGNGRVLITAKRMAGAS